ncbi:MAG: PAS domain S-box protein, partial [Vallitaleaceae bacterium]|nr:PAS domain S-box protein [Vallitaleaceae bacterium]
MKIVEISKESSLQGLFNSEFDYLNLQFFCSSMVQEEFLRQSMEVYGEDVSCLILVDQFDMSYLKYLEIMNWLSLSDDRVLWVCSNSKLLKKNNDNQFSKIRRTIVFLEKPQEICKAFFQIYHHYMEDRVSNSVRLNIRKSLNSILGSIGEGVLILDAHHQILFINKRASHILGVSESEAMESRFEDVATFIHRNTRETINGIFESLNEEVSFRGLPKHTVLVNRQKKEIFVSANITYLHQNLIKGYFMILRDISRIIETENHLKLLSKAIEYSPSSVVITSLDGTIEYVNPKFEELTGYEIDQVIGKNPSILKSGYTTQAEYQDLWATIRSGKIWEGELKNKKKSGEYYWERAFIGPVYNENHEIYRYIAVKQDITTEKALYEQMKRERRDLDDLIQNAPIGLIVMNAQESILKVNQRATEIITSKEERSLSYSGYTDINGMNLEDLMSQVTKNKRSFYSVEMRQPQMAETDQWIRVSSVPIEYRGKMAALTAIDDITESKNLEHQLEVAMEEAKEADKAKSAFLANMSHEIRTPINGIIGMTEITLASEELSKENETNLRMVQYSSKNLLTIINDILDISKLEAGKIQLEEIPFDIRPILFNTQKSFEFKAKDKELDFSVSATVEENRLLLGDPHRIQQVINNLLGNAIKFTQEGEVKLDVAIEVVDTKPILQICVQDTGIGISLDEHKKLFERFSQVDNTITRKFGGTGLGLAITKNLVELMQGTISCISEKGKGSQFHVQIPLKYSQLQSLSQTMDFEQEDQKKETYDILVVEDDRINQKIILAYLKPFIKFIDIAVDGEQAVEFCKRKQYEVIFMDIQLPKKDGVNAYLEIKELYRNFDGYTPVIAVTANALKGDREKFLLKGFDYYISKPFMKETIYKALQRSKDEAYVKMKKSYYDKNIYDLMKTLRENMDLTKSYFQQEK